MSRPHSHANADSAVSELAASRHLYGRFSDGYTEEGINSVFSDLSEATGLDLVCLWQFHDEICCGGESQWFAEDDHGRLWELSGDLYAWLSGHQQEPGPVAGWVEAASDYRTESLPWSDGEHNYAELHT
ncbi:hypothetical protein ACIQC7_35520 [Kitasatospora sp. NPDC088556]|uniref:hypothetical protein n=1 Tax=Kitasatospora sp. NPDC088556 TaxID=3364076 RepID=UPI00381C5383